MIYTPKIMAQIHQNPLLCIKNMAAVTYGEKGVEKLESIDKQSLVNHPRRRIKLYLRYLLI